MDLHDARHALLARLIDHAPLFPPASLPLPGAVAEDERARESPWSFVLGRFVCPASLLGVVPPLGRGLSVVLDEPIPSGVGADVEAVEARYRDDLTSLECLAADVYVEVPLDDALGERLDALVAHGLRAKVRCGGEQVPGVEELASFLRACRERGLAFKATAGLHHARRTGREHGFLNLLAAVVFGDEEDALADAGPGAFALDAGSFRWRDRSASAPALVRARSELLHSVGSCSFFEPVEELEALGALAS
jgi:hypothetical protein